VLGKYDQIVMLGVQADGTITIAVGVRLVD
jgi:hypothetical protein